MTQFSVPTRSPKWRAGFVLAAAFMNLCTVKPLPSQERPEFWLGGSRVKPSNIWSLDPDPPPTMGSPVHNPPTQDDDTPGQRRGQAQGGPSDTPAVQRARWEIDPLSKTPQEQSPADSWSPASNDEPDPRRGGFSDTFGISDIPGKTWKGIVQAASQWGGEMSSLAPDEPPLSPRHINNRPASPSLRDPAEILPEQPQKPPESTASNGRRGQLADADAEPSNGQSELENGGRTWSGAFRQQPNSAFQVDATALTAPETTEARVIAAQPASPMLRILPEEVPILVLGVAVGVLLALVLILLLLLVALPRYVKAVMTHHVLWPITSGQQPSPSIPAAEADLRGAEQHAPAIPALPTMAETYREKREAAEIREELRKAAIVKAILEDNLALRQGLLAAC